MSIVIYDGNTLYTDSGITQYGNYCTPQEKYHRLDDGAIFAWCGDLEDVQLATEYFNGKIKDKPELTSLQGILIYKDGSCKAVDKRLVPYKLNTPIFMGSGTDVAMGAYYASGDFRKAIEAACAITNSCALPVVEIKIKDC